MREMHGFAKGVLIASANFLISAHDGQEAQAAAPILRHTGVEATAQAGGRTGWVQMHGVPCIADLEGGTGRPHTAQVGRPALGTGAEQPQDPVPTVRWAFALRARHRNTLSHRCLLYTSDAADERSSV